MLTDDFQRAFILDHIQLARFMLFTILNAPPNYLWQQFLERSFPAYARSSSGEDRQDPEKGDAGTGARGEEATSKSKLNLRNTLIKWFVDCILLGAIFNTVEFLVLMGIMKGESFESICRNLKTVSSLAGSYLRENRLVLLTSCSRRRYLLLLLVTKSGRLRR